MAIRTQKTQIFQPVVISYSVLMLQLEHQNLAIPFRTNSTFVTDVRKKLLL